MQSTNLKLLLNKHGKSKSEINVNKPTKPGRLSEEKEP